MAKGQKRTSRETRKPKQAKSTSTVSVASGSAHSKSVQATFAQAGSDKKKPNA